MSLSRNVIYSAFKVTPCVGLKVREFSLTLHILFVNELLMPKTSMIANTIKTHISHNLAGIDLMATKGIFYSKQDTLS